VKLYHGTSSVFTDPILKDGLKPRRFTRRSNWKHTSPSAPAMVYLTECYAGYFANVAACNADPDGKGDHRWLIVEIDTDLLDAASLRPDEDWIAHNLGLLSDGRKSESEKYKFVGDCRRLMDLNPQFWNESVKRMGTCAHKGVIPPCAFSAAVVFNWEENCHLAAVCLEPIICPMNYKLMGDHYRALTQELLKVGQDVLGRRPVPQTL
jgi:hypothetical protein